LLQVVAAAAVFLVADMQGLVAVLAVCLAPQLRRVLARFQWWSATAVLVATRIPSGEVSAAGTLLLLEPQAQAVVVAVPQTLHHCLVVLAVVLVLTIQEQAG